MILRRLTKIQKDEIVEAYRGGQNSITLAKKYNFPLIPVYVEGRNSWFFYFDSYVNKHIRDVSQLNELFNKRDKELGFITYEDSQAQVNISTQLIADKKIQLFMDYISFKVDL